MAAAGGGSSDLDTDLYSRQLYVMGRDAMMQMSTSHVVIFGSDGLATEIAKNIVLGGIKRVTISEHDDHYHDTVTKEDTESGFYYSPHDSIGKSRIEILVANLRELNPNVIVDCSTFENVFRAETPVTTFVSVNRTTDENVSLNETCRKHNIKFVATSSRNMAGYIFNDFGNEFNVKDTTGEEAKTGIVVEIKKNGDRELVLTCAELHELSSDDRIRISSSGSSDREFVSTVLRCTSATSFVIESSEIATPCSFTQIKPELNIRFRTFGESLREPEIVFYDHFNPEKSGFLHELFHNKDISRECTAHKFSEYFTDEKYSHARCNAVFSYVIGAITSQEIMKSCTGKFMPIKQWFYFESFESIASVDLEMLDREIETANIFVVGAGAIGCEHLKNLAIMGVKNVVITDMDTIERSNLNRQFLFRPQHIKMLKSETAAREIMKRNPDMRITSLCYRVGPETEHVFNRRFFENTTCVLNALDNLPARLYVDSKCVRFKKPLLESGTLGTKGNVQIIVPHLTESYGSQADPPEKSIPMCTLKHYPYLIEHTIQWARDYFEGYFTLFPDYVNKFIDSIQKSCSDVTMQTNEITTFYKDLKKMRKLQITSVQDCVFFAIDMFHELFSTQIKDLVSEHPRDEMIDDTTPFWSGTKKCPEPIALDLSNELHIDFVLHTANLLAFVYNIDKLKAIVFEDIENNIEYYSYLDMKDEKKTYDESDRIYLIEEIKKMITPIAHSGCILRTHEFEKDDDSNHHIDFIHCASSLRAINYSISTTERQKTKGIAGKIIPAIATTTALVSGLVCLELYKVIGKKKSIDSYRNYFANLALPLLTFSEPVEAKRNELPGFEKTFTLWDNITFRNPTLREMMDYFRDNFSLDVNSIYWNGVIFLSPFTHDKEKKMSQTILDILREHEEEKDIEKHIENGVELTVICEKMHTEKCSDDDEEEDDEEEDDDEEDEEDDESIEAPAVTILF